MINARGARSSDEHLRREVLRRNAMATFDNARGQWQVHFFRGIEFD